MRWCNGNRPRVGCASWDCDSLARGAHGECGRRRHLHVELRGELQRPQFLHFLLQTTVLLGQILAAPFEELAIDLGLLELGPGKSRRLKDRQWLR